MNGAVFNEGSHVQISALKIMLSLFQVNVNCNGSNWRSKNPYYLRKQKPALIGRITEVLLVGKTFGTIERNYFLFIYLFIY